MWHAPNPLIRGLGEPMPCHARSRLRSTNTLHSHQTWHRGLEVTAMTWRDVPCERSQPYHIMTHAAHKDTLLCHPPAIRFWYEQGCVVQHQQHNTTRD